MDSKKLQMIFSQNLKNARNLAGLSQMKLAEAANLSVGYICDLESGRRWGTPETFSRLADALNINAFELLLPEPKDAQKLSELKKNRELSARIADALRKNLSSAISKAVSNSFKSL